jgi:hypothetical protein
MHPAPIAPARFSTRTVSPARTARGRSVAEVAERVIESEDEAARRILDTKKAGRAAPPGESLFSSLFNVAARGGKSPRASIVWSVYPVLGASSTPRCGDGRMRPPNALGGGPPARRHSRDSRMPCRGRPSVPGHPHYVGRNATSVLRARLAADHGDTYISRIVVEPFPIRRPIRSTRPRGDLTGTTRSGIVAFHR